MHLGSERIQNANDPLNRLQQARQGDQRPLERLPEFQALVQVLTDAEKSFDCLGFVHKHPVILFSWVQPHPLLGFELLSFSNNS
jgi:hypothetical protein